MKGVADFDMLRKSMKRFDDKVVISRGFCAFSEEKEK